MGRSQNHEERFSFCYNINSVFSGSIEPFKLTRKYSQANLSTYESNLTNFVLKYSKELSKEETDEKIV